MNAKLEIGVCEKEVVEAMSGFWCSCTGTSGLTALSVGPVDTPKPTEATPLPLSLSGTYYLGT